MNARIPLRILLPILTLTATLATAADVSRGELTPQQAGFLKSVDARLKQAEANLKAAQDAAGPADQKPSASRANLALSRSGAAKAQLQSVTDALTKLPADDATVKALAERAALAGRDIDALEKRLTGGAGPAMPAEGGVKLDYKQEKLLKDAQFYLREIQGTGELIAQVAAKASKAEEPDAFDHRTAAGAVASIEKMRGRKATIDGYFAQLPKDGAGVASTAAEVAKAMAVVDDAAKTLEPLNARLQKLVDPAGYPKLKEDFTRVQGLGQMLKADVFQHDPLRAADVVAQAPAGREELARVEKEYRLLMIQKTEDGVRIESVTRFLRENLASFDQAAAAKAKALPAEVQAELAKADALADQAVKEQKPAFFADGGGVPQRLGWAAQHLALLVALDPEGSKPSAKALADTTARLKQKAASLREGIITQNPLPPDRYTGADRQALIDRATAAWKQSQPDAQVLMVRIPSDAWQRESMWRLQNRTWYFIDRSKLQAQIIVKHDDRLAVIRPVNLWTDHANSNKLTAFPYHDDPKAELEPASFILIEKVK